MAGIPASPQERRDHNYPLIIAGGSAIFLNPEPIADFIDLFLIGEGEEMVPEFLAAYRAARAVGARGADDDRAGAGRGRLCAGIFRALYDELRHPACGALSRSGDIRGSSAAWSRISTAFSTNSLILTEESVFGDMYLVEASRGCQWGCRFCAAGFMYRPIRYRKPEELKRRPSEDLAAQGDRAGRRRDGQRARNSGNRRCSGRAGGRLSPSSLKADCISPQLASALGRNGNRSVTIAPEAGSERMRKVINKNLTEAEILRTTAMMVGEGVENLKLYFMVGLPEEHDPDVEEIALLTAKILDRARAGKSRIGHVTVSLNPFVPKPWTPFQWDPMQDVSDQE